MPLLNWMFGRKGGRRCAWWSSLFQIEGPPFLCKVRATNHCATSPSIASPHAKAKVQLLKPKWSEEKEVDVALGEVACSKNEGPHSLCKVRATSQCATSPTTGEVLSLASCYNRCHFSKMDFGRKGGRCCAWWSSLFQNWRATFSL